MTTRIEVDAHAGWDVAVVTKQLPEGKLVTTVVPAHTTQQFYIHSSMVICSIEEVGEPKAKPTDG